MSSVVIVGSNRGIGLEFVRQYAQNGNKVFALCRKTSDELSKIENVTVMEGFDVGTDEIVSKLENSNLPKKLDVVIVNAGIAAFNSNFESLSNSEKPLSNFNVNALG